MGNADKSPASSAKNPSLLAGRNSFERLLVSFIGKRTPKCREVVRLLSQSMEVKLPVTTRIKIRFSLSDLYPVLPLRKTAASVAGRSLQKNG
jgi:hypothetical protein